MLLLLSIPLCDNGNHLTIKLENQRKLIFVEIQTSSYD